MVVKIIHNSFTRRVKLSGIRLARTKEFYIWSFVGEDAKKYTGFTPVAAYYGGKLHRWYSLFVGYYLPESYTINFDNIIEKKCVAVLGPKGVVRSIIPIQEHKKATEQDTNFHQNPSESEDSDKNLFGEE